MKAESLARRVRKLELSAGTDDWRTIDVALMERIRQEKLAEIDAMEAMNAEERTAYQAESRRKEIERLAMQAEAPDMPAELRTASLRLLKYMREAQ